MPLTIHREDYEFLLTSTKFCNKIDKYIIELGLDNDAIMEFQEDNELLQYFLSLPQNYSTCGESFTRYKIQNMRINFSHLSQACKNSDAYTFAVGIDLGIEVQTFAFNIN